MLWPHFWKQSPQEPESPSESLGLVCWGGFFMRDAFIPTRYSYWTGFWSECSSADVTPQGEKLSRNVCCIWRWEWDLNRRRVQASFKDHILFMCFSVENRRKCYFNNRPTWLALNGMCHPSQLCALKATKINAKRFCVYSRFVNGRNHRLKDYRLWEPSVCSPRLGSFITEAD